MHIYSIYKWTNQLITLSDHIESISWFWWSTICVCFQLNKFFDRLICNGIFFETVSFIWILLIHQICGEKLHTLGVRDIRYWPRRLEIDLDLTTLNEGRQKLKNAVIVTIFVPECICLVTTWKMIRCTFDLVEFKRIQKNIFWIHLSILHFCS